MSIQINDSIQMTDNSVRDFFDQTLEYTGNPLDRIDSRQMVLEYNDWKEFNRRDEYIPKFFNKELAAYLRIPIYELKAREDGRTYYVGFKRKAN